MDDNFTAPHVKTTDDTRKLFKRVFAEPNTCGLCISDEPFMGNQPNNSAVTTATHELRAKEWLVISDE